MDSIRSLRVSFYSNYLYHPLLFGFISRHSSSSPNIRYTFFYHRVRYSLSLIYKGIRLYARVTNLGPEGKQTLQSSIPPPYLAVSRLLSPSASPSRSHLEFAIALFGRQFAMSKTRPPLVTINAPDAPPAVHIARGGQDVKAYRQPSTCMTSAAHNAT